MTSPAPFVFDRVRGQSRAIGALRDAVRLDRVSQAYLFHGPWGVGKTTAALALAAALNCEADTPRRPCGTCLSCRKTASFNHPDVHLVMPVFPAALWKEEAAKRGDDAAQGALCRLYAEWAADPLHVYSWSKRPSIATEWVLEVKQEASRKTFEGRSKVIVLAGVDSTGVEASNRMLKMLEEPGPRTVFVLTTSRLHRVLPTIRSRCQRVGFGDVPADDIRDLLVTGAGIPEKDAGPVAALAGGSVARALVLGGAGVLETRAWVLGLLGLSPDDLVARLSTDVLGDSRAWDAPRVRHVAEVLLTWYRDVLRLKCGVSESGVVNHDALVGLRAASETLDVPGIARRVRALEELVGAVEGSVTPSLALFTTLTDVIAEDAPSPA